MAEIPQKGKPFPLAARERWVVERTNSLSNAHKKLVWCAERTGLIIDFWFAFSGKIVAVGRAIRSGRTRHLWEGKPRRGR